VILDYVLTVAVDAVKKTCQVVVRAHHGPAVCLRGLDVVEADRVLAEVARAASELDAETEPGMPAQSAQDLELSPDPSAAAVAEPPS
jgi:hypothetical protein